LISLDFPAFRRGARITRHLQGVVAAWLFDLLRETHSVPRTVPNTARRLTRSFFRYAFFSERFPRRVRPTGVERRSSGEKERPRFGSWAGRGGRFRRRSTFAFDQAKPKIRRCSFQSFGGSAIPARRIAESSIGCRPSTIAVVMSGARKPKRRIRVK